MSAAFRLPGGGRIRRDQPLQFSFNGEAVEGFAGDTVASALLAQGSFFTNGPLGVARGMSHPDGQPIVALSPASTGGLPR